MPTRTEINGLYAAANELKSMTKERDELRGAVARAIKAINEFEQEVAELKEKLAEYEKRITEFTWDGAKESWVEIQRRSDPRR